MRANVSGYELTVSLSSVDGTLRRTVARWGGGVAREHELVHVETVLPRPNAHRLGTGAVDGEGLRLRVFV